MADRLLKHIDTSGAMLLLKPVRQQICFCFPSRHNGYRECLIIATLMALNDTSVPTVTFRNTSVVNKVISKQLLSSHFRGTYEDTLRNHERQGHRQTNMHVQTHLQLSRSPYIWPLDEALHIWPNPYVFSVTHQWVKSGQFSGQNSKFQPHFSKHSIFQSFNTHTYFTT